MTDSILLNETQITKSNPSQAALHSSQIQAFISAVIVGNVDDGKSTFLGRLLHDTGNLLPERIVAIQESCERRNSAFEWSFILDAFQLERDQGITIDTTELMIKLPDCQLLLIDAPGHLDFIQNMMTGASKTNNAIIVIDAERGIHAQTKRHLFILRLLGIQNIIILCNKMDAIDYNEEKYEALYKEIKLFSDKIQFNIVACIPISAKSGENLCTKSQNMPWYFGLTALEALLKLPPSIHDDLKLTLFEIQSIQRKQNERFIHAHLISGSLHLGQKLYFYPGEKESCVKSIIHWPDPKTQIQAPAAMTFEITDDLFLTRGCMGTNQPHYFENRKEIDVTLFWFGTMNMSHQLLYFKWGLQQSQIVSLQIICKIDHLHLETLPAHEINQHHFYRCRLLIAQSMNIPLHSETPFLGHPIICDQNGYPCALAYISTKNDPFHELIPPNLLAQHLITTQNRIDKNATHPGHVFWLTGLSGAGKSTLAMKVEAQLFNDGYRVYVLDGDNLRSGLNSDLGFTQQDRKENIRRTAEVAKLFVELGYIVIVSLITPTENDRLLAKTLCGESFSLVHIDASLDTCERRDPKKLYQKARQGLIKDFTGINSPFEAPLTADYVITNNLENVSQNTEKLCGFIRTQL